MKREYSGVLLFSFMVVGLASLMFFTTQSLEIAPKLVWEGVCEASVPDVGMTEYAEERVRLPVVCNGIPGATFDPEVIVFWINDPGPVYCKVYDDHSLECRGFDRRAELYG